MRIRVTRDAAALAVEAADAVCALLHAEPGAALGLPTGTTPVETYAELARRSDAGDCALHGATGWAIDEFAGVAADAPGTNRWWYARHLRVPLRALHVPEASAPDPQHEIEAFAARLATAGGLALCLLGVGENGHLAFNEPGSRRDSRARAVELTETSRRAHAENFGSLAAVPRRAMTLGIADLLEARALLVLAHGASKAAIVRAAIEGPQTAEVPASWLRDHDDVLWLLDEAAASGLTRA
ncbi:MAG TPA: glucosamine-6-phosphate deaminase [Dehalococcoidia bacterium]|nr:glucosamine-6-phosphate deaminase [Dehalococcoidia bacterium]